MQTRTTQNKHTLCLDGDFLSSSSEVMKDHMSQVDGDFLSSSSEVMKAHMSQVLKTVLEKALHFIWASELRICLISSPKFFK